jgi:GNAT superfamily N-acetyltransferase
MITFQEETYDEVFKEMTEIFPTHWKELALDQEQVPLDPQYEVYRDREKAGQLLVLTIRKDSVMVGYFIGFVCPALHYKTCLTCTMDIFYVHPDHRGGSLGVKLFTRVKDICKSRGVKKIVVGSKMHKDASVLFERLGYTEIERFFSLWIGD